MPSSALVIRVPSFLVFGFDRGAHKETKRQKGIILGNLGYIRGEGHGSGIEVLQDCKAQSGLGLRV